MRAFNSVLFSLTLLTVQVFANPDAVADDTPKQRFDYQSDVARLRNIVINSLYSHRDVFLRELVSNANDALEKLRLTALTEKEVLEGAEHLNITIKAVKDEDGPARIIITDTGIGMTAEELTKNLGTLAKSGTTEFLQKAESSADTTGTGNLIGAFGLGFYSSFLVADHVHVASVAARSSKNPEPAQVIFSSSADDSSFEVFPDPRGNTLGRGTEITLILKDDATEYLETSRLTELIKQHSSFSSSFPIYLFTQRQETVPVEEDEITISASSEEASASSTEGEADSTASTEAETDPTASTEGETDSTPSLEVEPEFTPTEAETAAEGDLDEDEVVIEETAEAKDTEEFKVPETKTVTIDEWVQMNAQAPIWTRDPKTVTDEEYEAFYSATWKDHEKPLAWHHFHGDSGSGVSFRAIIYIPSTLDESYWREGLEGSNKDLRLLVKRTFITNSLGDHALPKWASWLKVVVDAEDLPLNVSRETLQSTKFLKQLRSIIIRRLLQTLNRVQEDDKEMFEKIHKVYGNVFKLGAAEDNKSREKLAALVRFPTTHRNHTSLDEYLESKKQGQKQIFYLADMGKSEADLAKSVFVEKLQARGYEVLLLSEPLDEVFVQNLKKWKKVSFQDVAKAGLKFGDEELDPKEEKERQKQLTEEYKPLLDWLRKEAGDVVRDVVISNRLVASSCAIVADAHGYTANIEKMMNANNNPNKGFMHEYAKKQKTMEINPRSPLIEGLLKRVKQLPTEEEERDIDAEDELKEVTTVLIDGALVRSGFDVKDSNEFFSRVDRILRRSLGVSETAPTDTTVKPAPPVDPELPTEEEPEDLSIPFMQPKVEPEWEVEEVDEEDNVVKPAPHDEL